MRELRYLDFDLAIEQEGEIYRARVLHSPAGQAEIEFRQPLSDGELENLYLRVGRTRAGMRRIDSADDIEAAKRVGSRLFAAVFKEEIYASYRSSLAAAQAQGLGLRLRLRINAPDLHEIPWEYLYNPHQDLFLSLSVETPIVRYLDLMRPEEVLEVNPPLRVLGMIASPRDCPDLNAAREWEKLVAALEPLVRGGLVELARVQPPSLEALQRQLRRGEWHVFHFIGHGKFDPQAQDGLLLFEDESGRGNPLSGNYLGTFLHDHRPLRLAIINACEGARTSRTDPFAGVAQGLVRHGIPAVIAMQFEITDTAAIVFAQEFYAAIADGYPVDGALAEARKAIFAKGNDIEWGTPVLFTRSPDGRIFKVATDKAIPRTDRVEPNAGHAASSHIDLEELHDLGLAAYLLEDWELTCQYFEQLVAARPGYPGVAEKLAEARKKLERDKQAKPEPAKELYRRGLRALEQGKWHEAQGLFQRVIAIQPDYSNAAGLLKIAEARLQEGPKAPKDETKPPPTSPLKQPGRLHGTISLETLGGVASPLMSKGEALPASSTSIFSTAADGQTSVEVHLGFGDNAKMADNLSLGKFLLDGILPAPRGVPQVEVTIVVDENLHLSVKAKDLATGRTQTFENVDLGQLTPATAASPAPAQINDFISELEAAGIKARQGDLGDLKEAFGEGVFSEFFQSMFGGTSRRSEAGRDAEQSITISLEDATLGAERVIVIDQGGGQQKRLAVRIPKGAKTGSRIRLAGVLSAPDGAGKDLYLVITVADHPLFRRSDDDLVLEYPLEKRMLNLGRSIQVPLIEGGKTTVRVPANVQTGTEIRVPGKGAARLKGDRGDLRVVLLPYDPHRVDDKVQDQVGRIRAALAK